MYSVREKPCPLFKSNVGGPVKSGKCHSRIIEKFFWTFCMRVARSMLGIITPFSTNPKPYIVWKLLRGKRFQDDDVEIFVHNWLNSSPKSLFKNGIKKLPIRWEKCISKSGSSQESDVRLCIILYSLIKGYKTGLGLFWFNLLYQGETLRNHM